MPSFKCPYCDEVSSDKAVNNRHVSGHLVEKIKTSYPGLFETIEKIENEMSVKFMIKVDVNKILVEDKLVQNLLVEMDKETDQ